MSGFNMIGGGPRPTAPSSHAAEVGGPAILTGRMATDPAAPGFGGTAPDVSALVEVGCVARRR